MTYTYELSAQDQSRMFIYGYYHRPVLWFQRRYLGPLLLLIALAYLLVDRTSMAIYLDAFFIFVGAYYIARPFVLRARHSFDKSRGTISVGSEGISIANEAGELRVPAGKILKAFVRGRYLFVKVFLGTRQYYMIDLQAIRNDREQLVGDITSLVKTRTAG